MVWNWLEYRMNLQHIGRAWGRPHEKPSKTCCDKGLLWNTFVHVVMYAYYGLKVGVDPLVHGAGCCPVGTKASCCAGFEDTYDLSLDLP